jgi:condensin-2 complex subunit D3
VLKKLSSKHLITHILPVVMSLKHVLEASNSPLQGPLMEYLVYLMKQHRPEVDEALQFDPTLRAEIEYDLKQYEKNKRDSSSRLSPRQSMAADGASVLTGPVPMPSSDRLPTGTIVKPVLRRSLGGSEGRGRTPLEALKSPGKLPSSPLFLSLSLSLCLFLSVYQCSRYGSEAITQ